MTRSSLSVSRITVAALGLALSACASPKVAHLYPGPERPIEQTALLVSRVDHDGIGVTGGLEGHIESIDGKPLEGGHIALLPGQHSFSATWDYASCRLGYVRPGDPASAIILGVVFLTGCAATQAWPSYEDGSSTMIASLEAGKEYRFRIDGIDGKVLAWIEEKETGRAIRSAISHQSASNAAATAKAGPEVAKPSTNLAGILWDGEWFGKDGSWYLYVRAENGTIAGRIMRRGDGPYRVTGLISAETENQVTGRIEDEKGAPIGSLSGKFPNVSFFQGGRARASFGLEKRS
jgi:hypothetical protein